VVNPWLELPKRAPFVLKHDKKSVAKSKFNTHRLPEPFIGNTTEAKLVLLNLNPSTGKKDRTPQNKGKFAQAVRANLRSAKSAYPFYYLNPEFERHEGFRWWNQRLQELLFKCSRKHCARKHLSERILAVEFCAYPSKRKQEIKGRLAGDDFRDYLVKGAMKRGAHIIIMKGLQEWLGAIPELEKYPQTWILRNPQNANIKAENLARCANKAFTKILKAVSK